MNDPALRKYFDRYAEAEHRWARALDGEWDHALVVPARRESAALLDGYASASAGRRVLCIVVVNGTEGNDDREHRVNAELIETLRARTQLRPLTESGCDFGSFGAFDVAVLDRASPGRRLPPKQGVGLARKIGIDFAVAAWRDGKVASDFVHTTDADATLPAGYFDAPPDDPTVAAAVYPLWHEAARDPDVSRAVSLYEVYLRYTVLGLRWAESPYAFHTIGSLLAVRAGSYVQVRGVPKREAGEDFHLLCKLAKVGGVVPVGGEPVRIAARLSDRVPFGTGPRSERLVHEVVREGGTFDVDPPDAFEVLREWLVSLREFAAHRDVGRCLDRAHPAARTLLARLDVERALEDASSSSPDAGIVRRRLSSWFDGLRSRQLLSAVRDHVGPLPLERALAAAPFVDDSSGTLTEIRRRLADREAAVVGQKLGVVGGNTDSC